MIYLYILTWIKHESFNPETILRTFVTWNCKNKGPLFRKDVLNWSWVYRLRQDQIKNIVQNLDHREKVIHEELKKKFTFSEENQAFVLKKRICERYKKRV